MHKNFGQIFKTLVENYKINIVKQKIMNSVGNIVIHICLDITICTYTYNKIYYHKKDYYTTGVINDEYNLYCNRFCNTLRNNFVPIKIRNNVSVLLTSKIYY